MTLKKPDSFTFLRPGRLRDGDLELVLVQTTPPNPRKNWAPSYQFDMRLAGTSRTVGHVNFRIGNMDNVVLYGGHIGYDVSPPYRGRHFAARSCRLLFPFARRHGLDILWITCNPDNIASRRTCEIAGGQFIEIIDLPPDNNMYKDGERQKCRYRFDLKKLDGNEENLGSAS